jgi:hypothetical protein
MAAASQGCRAVVYRRRHSEQTVLYQVVQRYLETSLARAAEDDADGQRVPAYEERELRRYTLPVAFAARPAASVTRRAESSISLTADSAMAWDVRPQRPPIK